MVIGIVLSDAASRAISWACPRVIILSGIFPKLLKAMDPRAARAAMPPTQVTLELYFFLEALKMKLILCFNVCPEIPEAIPIDPTGCEYVGRLCSAIVKRQLTYFRGASV